MIRVALVLLLGLSLVGCIHSAGGIAASNIPLSPGSYTELGRTKGNDCVYFLFGFLPISGGNETHAAVQRAIQHGNGDALINVTSDTYTQSFIIFTRTCTQVVATAVRLND